MRCLVLFIMVWFGSVQPAHSEKVNLDQLLRQIRQSQDLKGQGDNALEARFLSQEDKQQLVKKVRGEVSREKKKSQTLAEKLKANEAQLAELEADLDERAADFGELFAVVQQVAGDTNAGFTNSLITAHYPDRVKSLETIVEGKALPDIPQMEALWYVLQQDMTETGKVVKFPAQIDTAAGAHRETEVVRIGPFVAVADGLYLNYLPEIGQLVEFARQPATRYLELAEDLARAQSGQVTAAIDPTSGVILGMLGRAPNVTERIQQGGIIGYIILVLGTVGLVITAVRMVYLSNVRRHVDHQLKHLEDAQTDNPLGRVLAVSEAEATHDIETLELMVDEAVVHERPALEKGQAMVKLLAAVAPLLGLLGTVTGMIETFQSISLYGTGDPKLMASGISQALVTTMLGLMVAIPLLFLHSLMATRSKGLMQILDEQSAGFVSRAAESRVQ